MSDLEGLEEVVREFLIESHEGLDHLDESLVRLEDDPSDADIIADIFRTMHSIKGTGSFLGFSRLERVAHTAENLMSSVRDGTLPFTSDIASGLLKTMDALRRMLEFVEASGNDGEEDHDDLITLLTALHDEGAQASKTPAPSPKKDATPEPPSEVRQAPPAAQGGGVADRSIRLDVGVLDHLMNLVGEMVLARNQIMQNATIQSDQTFIASAQRLDAVTSELQEGVMKARLQPIGHVWTKFPRVVRDLALACGKKARIEMHGKTTELDRTIIEAIRDPLTHAVRNAVDHGIELPEDRKAANKPEEGVLKVRASHEGGQVSIAIEDDGRGIDPAKIRDKAVSLGILSPERAAALGDRESLQLIFAPGFSTAGAVTNVSGRGVGMDVVKTNIERIGGNVDIQSRIGEGTSITMTIPLTLAIIPALIVTASGERFAIPSASLVELVRLDGEQARTGIESFRGAPVYRLRGQLLPLVFLGRELDLQDATGETDDASDVPARSVNVVVLQADRRQFGVVVDDIHDTEEIVVKPLGKLVQNIDALAGATIMGDGRVALILDVMGLAARAHVHSDERDVGGGSVTADAEGASDSTKQTVLVFESDNRGRLAVRLSLVSRLESLSSATVELASGRPVVQYRGGIMPLVHLETLIDGDTSREAALAHRQRLDDPEDSMLQLVVCAYRGEAIGVVVDRIVDIASSDIDVAPKAVGSGEVQVVIQQRVTEIVDLAGLLAQSGRAAALPEAVLAS